MPGKILIILTGATFRFGGQHNLDIGDEKSYDGQKEACLSHLRFAEHLETNYNMTSDFIFESYATPYQEDLRSWYPNNSQITFHQPFKSYPWLLNTAVSRISDIEQYSAVLFIRGDLFLKDGFVKAFKLFEKITFSFIVRKIHWLHGHNKRPKVGDMILYVPKKHFYVMSRGTISLSHDSYNDYHAEHLGFMVEGAHDANSEKYPNPLYRIVNRPESTKVDEEAKTMADFDGIWEDDLRYPKMPETSYPSRDLFASAASPASSALVLLFAMISIS
jgi:hypothetical protein